jgi:hypothetical protein
MSWFKRLFGLSSGPAPRSAAAESADGPAGESGLPAPPAGFTWQRFEQVRMAVLRPNRWHVHQVGNDQSFTGCISKDSIPAAGSFQTGLTLQVFREALPDGLFQRDPDAAIVGMVQARYPAFFSDACNELMYVDQIVQRTSHSRLWRVQVRQALPGTQPIIIRKLLIIFEQSNNFYDFTFEAPQRTWDENWRKGEQMFTNLVFCVDPLTNLEFSADPPLPPDQVLHAKLLEVGRALAWPLAHEDRSQGLFIWRVSLVVPSRAGSGPIDGCFSWYMKRVHNEIWVNDPVQLAPLDGGSSLEAMEEIGVALFQLQEDFKRRWLALVGPVTLRGASPQTHATEIQVQAMLDILGAKEQ